MKKLLDMVTGQPDLNNVPDKVGKDFKSIFIYLLIAYSAFCTWQMATKNKDTVSIEMYNALKDDYDANNAFIREMVPLTERQKMQTLQVKEEVEQKVDSVKGVVEPAVEAYNEGYKQLKRK